MDTNPQENSPRRNKLAVYVDDNRTPTEIPEGYDPWVITRGYKEFTEYIQTLYRTEKRMPDLISFDHDLTTEYIHWYFEHPGERIVDYKGFATKSGMHCAIWFMEACKQNNIDFSGILFAVHSHNELGTKNIQECVNGYKRGHYGEGKANCFLKDWVFEYDQKAVQQQQKEHNNGGRNKNISQEGPSRDTGEYSNTGRILLS